MEIERNRETKNDMIDTRSKKNNMGINEKSRCGPSRFSLSKPLARELRGEDWGGGEI